MIWIGLLISITVLTILGNMICLKGGKDTLLIAFIITVLTHVIFITFVAVLQSFRRVFE